MPLNYKISALLDDWFVDQFDTLFINSSSTVVSPTSSNLTLATASSVAETDDPNLDRIGRLSDADAASLDEMGRLAELEATDEEDQSLLRPLVANAASDSIPRPRSSGGKAYLSSVMDRWRAGRRRRSRRKG